MKEQDTHQKIRIAIADDHTIIRKGVMELINTFGEFEVILDAVNGADLLQKIAAAPQLPDICMLDINMPELDGYETAKAIRSRWPDIRILALSMYDSEYNIIRMLRSGANGYILKETDPKELRRALNEIYERSFYHSEIVTGRLINKLHQNASTADFEFSEREQQFLSLCCTEMSYKGMAEQMNLSPRTVEGYRDALFEKLNIRTRTGLVIFAIRIGLCN
jgi:DNA-binding NarL/FixJ family response regulator